MQEYVAGFLFNRDRSMVALVRKNRPEWQNGRLNGIGGKIEPGEGQVEAQRREFLEETGVDIPEHKWDMKVILEKDDDWRVYFFCAFDEAIWETRTVEDEEIIKMSVDLVMGDDKIIPNVKWIIGMCLDPLLGRNFYTIRV